MRHRPKIDQDSKRVLEDIRTAVAQIGAGKGVSNEVAKAELRKRFRR